MSNVTNFTSNTIERSREEAISMKEAHFEDKCIGDEDSECDANSFSPEDDPEDVNDDESDTVHINDDEDSEDDEFPDSDR
mmetsp:Transcript_26759/g.39718  ORF Transcript_26759/g.39718 Transcript_26759/m.39718 type:complete len:80 (-) Transcript_26759:165-404(-)|eukprot:CAMPEP_0185023716 /NCGR_PEP_ID=MMETSP1103-20130426/6361_1 /TAXON_ID=36769 /ORGANISM="Paraphysomonas bandaiensis, Strain Caron Lab Isolate" /LENGTH=79 /DNA_ID=CAMNT_0027556441 /DNA_START=143 /DNA_END=382 /DNA_ORIENTATION=+